jgi:hypothetical protein
LETAACLTPIADDRRRSAAGDFAIRQGEPPPIMMNVHCQNRTHHCVRGRAKQVFELWWSGRCDLGAEANAGCVQEPMFIGFADVDWCRFSFHAERQRLLRIMRNATSGSKVIRCPQRHHSQNRPGGCGMIH